MVARQGHSNQETVPSSHHVQLQMASHFILGLPMLVQCGWSVGSCWQVVGRILVEKSHRLEMKTYNIVSDNLAFLFWMLHMHFWQTEIHLKVRVTFSESLIRPLQWQTSFSNLILPSPFLIASFIWHLLGKYWQWQEVGKVESINKGRKRNALTHCIHRHNWKVFWAGNVSGPKDIPHHRRWDLSVLHAYKIIFLILLHVNCAASRNRLQEE